LITDELNSQDGVTLTEIGLVDYAEVTVFGPYSAKNAAG
jgi:hypothetical protein